MTAQAQPNTIMYGVGIVVIIGMIVYYLFMAVNGFGLAEETATASVTGKSYREAGQTYSTQVIDGRSYVRSQATPDAYLVHVMLNDREATAQVDRPLFDSVDEGHQVEVVYRRLRLTGGTQILRVTIASQE